MYEEIRLLRKQNLAVDILFFVGLKTYLEYLRDPIRWIKSVRKTSKSEKIYVKFRFPHDTNFFLKLFFLSLNFIMLFFNFSLMNRYENYQQIHSHNAAMSFYSCLLAKIFNVDSIFDCHGIRYQEMQMSKKHRYSRLRKKLDIFIEHFAFCNSGTVLTVSQSMKHYIKKISVTPTITLPMCIDAQANPYSIAKSHKIRNYLKLKDKRVIVYSGSFAEWQCFEEMSQLLLTLQSLKNNYHFLFLIPKNDKKAVVNFLHERNLFSNSSVYSVRKSRVKYLLSASHIGLMLRKNSPVNKVSSPTKFSEYVQSGIPVIASDYVGDFSNLIKKEKLGTIVDLSKLTDINYVKNLSLAIEKILKSVDSNYFRDFIESTLSWDLNSKELVSTYRSNLGVT
tara:strand:+ start:3511 stop:4689 length:1179 start_codon:yes stop_codon:yes gene_type:complete